MKIAMSTFYYTNFSKLADKTVPVMREYCRKHGYAFFEQQIEDESTDETKNIISAGIHNLEIPLGLLENQDWIDVLFVCGVDVVITDSEKKIEYILNGDKYKILTGSDWDGISTSQMIIKNHELSRLYLLDGIDEIEDGDFEHDQEYFKRRRNDWIFPTEQRVMNSYDCEARMEGKENPGNWQEGDFLVHMAGMTLKQRMDRVDYWLGRAH